MTRYTDNWTARITATLALALAAGCAPTSDANLAADGRHELAAVNDEEGGFELVDEKTGGSELVPVNQGEQPTSEPTAGDKNEGDEGVQEPPKNEGDEGIQEPPKTDGDDIDAEAGSESVDADAEPPRGSEENASPERPDEHPEPIANAATDYCEVSPGQGGEAIQVCLSQVAENQGEVHIAAGEYIVTETLQVPTGVTLVGAGATTVLTLEGRTDQPVLAVGSLSEEPASTTTDVTIRDLAIYGAAEDQTSSTVPGANWLAVSGLLIRSAERVHVQGVIISETLGAGITVEVSSRDISMTDVQVYDGAFDGIAIQDSNNVRVERAILSGNGGAGLSLDWGVDGASVTEAVITDNGYSWAGGDNPGVYMAMTFNSAIEKSEIKHNDGNGIVLTNQGMADAPSQTCSSNNAFSGNDISGNGQFGFWLTHGTCADNTGFENTLRQNTWGPVFEPVTGQLDQRDTVCDGNGCAQILD